MKMENRVKSIYMKKEIVIYSSLDELARVRRFLKPLISRLPLGEKERANVEFCIIEAAINAIKHGNKNDKLKKVRITFERREDRVSIEITDCGDGFDPDSIEDPREPSRIVNTSGRGIFFMRQMMSSVRFEFTTSGTTIFLEKYFDVNPEYNLHRNT
jgi:serine/threonine-protein kinase RsbW